ncbi:hypothetical protein SAMN05216420_101363 [Nitrosospira sp. Nl5]|nr:hypothetical protein SAMN05216420_101363 [Nitrosospira sp. Nl5]
MGSVLVFMGILVGSFVAAFALLALIVKLNERPYEKRGQHNPIPRDKPQA